MAVLILLSTYNGEKYLEEQLNSIINQTDVELQIIVRDDGSTDRTCEILEKWSKRGLLSWYKGKNVGPAQSFLDLLLNAPESDYYAFADQDDFWMPEKMVTAVSKLDGFSPLPSLYMSEKIVVDENLNFLFKTDTNLDFTLIESLTKTQATGCTFVFNSKLRKEIIKNIPTSVKAHDLWVYRVAVIIKAKIIYDKESYIMYRQHDSNVVGLKKQSNISKIKNKVISILKNRRQKDYRSNALYDIESIYPNLLSIKEHRILTKFINYKSSFLAKLSFAFDSNLKHRNLMSRFSFILSVLTNKY